MSDTGQRSDELIDGRFRLLRRLGSGRLGDIYEARVDTGPESAAEQVVALQLFDRRIVGDLALIDKLRRGYAAIKAGPHRNVVRLEELGRDRKTWYLVIERLEGASLRFVLDDVGLLRADEALPIVRAVGDALSYLHAKGMAHGAVTPSAVFVTEDYEVKLLDIVPACPPSGLPAESVQDSRKASAPDPIDDVFGLACLTYELLTGRHPYNYSTAAEARRLGLEPAPIAELPPVRWQALARALATSREERTSSVAVFLLDLGSSGTERRAGSDRPPSLDSRETSDEMPLVTTPRDRLAGAPPPEPDRRGWFWPVFGAVVVGFLAAVVWVYQIPIRDVVVGRLTAVGIEAIGGDRAGDDVIDGAGDGGSSVPEASSAVSESATSDEIARVDIPPIPEAISAGRESAAALEAPSLPETTPVPSISTGADAAEEAQAAVEGDAQAASEAAPEPQTTAPPAAPEPDTPPEPSRFALAEGPIRAEEGGPAAAIEVIREGGIAWSATIVWWTTEDTARAGEDYADLGQQAETFEPGMDTLTLYVPLVDDGIDEPPEGFLVSIGQPNPGSPRVEAIATIGVIIQDDDNSPR